MNTITARHPRWKPHAFLASRRAAPPAPKRFAQVSLLLPTSLACTALGLACMAGLFTAFALGVRTIPLGPAWLCGLVRIATGRMLRGGW
jgi:hypothetical protein